MRLPWPHERIETACVIEVEHSHESLHAHVALADDLPIYPGDRVKVHGRPIRVAFGQRLTEHRTATVERALPLERLWTRLTQRFSLAELYEVSFSPGRIS